MKPEKKSAPRKRSASHSGEPSATTGRARPAARITAGQSEVPSVELKSEGAPAKKQAKPGKPSAKTASRGAPLKIPPILLEGDEPGGSFVSGPGQRYSLGPTPPSGHLAPGEESGELPDAYGTKKLLLAARDPHWLYAHWDLRRDQLRDFNRLSSDGHLVLRAYIEAVAGAPFAEVHVHPESRNWFVHVGRGGTRFVAELGYYAKADGQWVGISVSGPTLTPSEAVSSDTTVNFASIPIEVPFEELLAVVRAAINENIPLTEAILQLRADGRKGLPGVREIKAALWTPAQERALAELISMDSVRRVWMGSLEITELIRRKLAREISSVEAAQFSLPENERAGAIASVSSPFGGVERKKGFWFDINAELIIYGATEADAKVTVGGRQIKLRPDGSFSFRFALPDGQYELPVVAVSSDQTDGRAAGLTFRRNTEYSGEVGLHPQDPQLNPPRVENLA